MAYSKNRPHVTITPEAHRHLMKIVRAKKKLGFSDNNTKLTSQFILLQPIPTQTNPAPSVEIHKMNDEAIQQ